jgi:hypothetical protein
MLPHRKLRHLAARDPLDPLDLFAARHVFAGQRSVRLVDRETERLREILETDAGVLTPFRQMDCHDYRIF